MTNSALVERKGTASKPRQDTGRPCLKSRTARWAAVGATAALLGLLPIALAPIAAADTQHSAESDMPSCTNTGNIVSGTSTVCESPGNTQITSSPGELSEPQYEMWPWYGGIGIPVVP
ncbi:Uncharacterised protein [Mycobacteroides abscessus subsp. bolletii]|nr:Uncharacterised protein [Mycobacteroides abscessus subsp. bolletii]SKF65582.1 Uncharacterised protein [Mycobacteroides abscessus subsp. bolletii]SKF98236.1 Uncharacterised protein [Mycobacteroides abscessus subsp. bolletii]SKG45868.1 Uncharacterised protein [Mycobacteroides abscessus subsp. bolletii]SKH77582.1 Uncharacterised protein [Mycobacteroides abscessus subsp. bolletii]